MIYRKQLNGHDPDQGIWGDCFRTCIACLLDMEPEEVPHFADGDVTGKQVVDACQRWLGERGLYLVCMHYEAEHSLRDIMQSVTHNNPGLRYMVSGKSPRGTCHVVVFKDDAVDWDPGLGEVSDPDESLVGPCDCDDGREFWFVEFIGKLV